MGNRWIVNLCPFLHFDNSRTQTYEHNISIVSWNVKSVLDFLDVHADHKFCLDQVTLFEGFGRLFPNYLDTLHERVLEGRIEVVGGTYVMPDFLIPDGESIVRQFLLGNKFFREELGVDLKTGWAIDSAGHCAQLPQILRQCGIDSYFFWRGMQHDSPTEFVWKGPDGSRVNAIWLSNGFEQAAWLSENTREAFSKLMEIVETTAPRAASQNVFLPVGGELVPPLPHLIDLVNQWNSTFPDMKMVILTPREFTDKLKSVRAELPVITGQFSSGRFSGIRSGGLSSRVKMKVMNRKLETLLHLLELYLSILGEHSKNMEVENIWRILLFNQDHNLIRGTCAEEPYQLALRRFRQGIEMAETSLDSAVQLLSSSVTPAEEGVSLVVLNPLPWARTDIVSLKVDSSKFDSEFFEIKDPEGNSIPHQYVVQQDDADSVEIFFVGENLPSLGHRVYSLVPTEIRQEFDSDVKTGSNWMESDNFVVEFDEFSGAVSRLFDKLLQFEVVTGGANYITMEGEVGDLYRHLKSEHSTDDSDLTTLRTSGELALVDSGPVRAVFEVTGAIDKSTRRQRVKIYRNVPRIDFETEIDLRATAKRVRLNVPLNVFTDSVMAGSQFHMESRSAFPVSPAFWEDPMNGVFDALDWIDCVGPDAGVCFSAPGLHEFEFSDGLLSATLLRSVDHLSRGLDDEVVESKSAREIGVHSFRYTLIPHEGDSVDAEVWRRSTEHRIPLIANLVVEPSGELPTEMSIMEIESGTLGLSCYKPTDIPDEFVVRVFEMAGESGTAIINFHRDIESVTLVDLVENEIGELSFEGRSVHLPIDGHSIVTLRMKFTS
ncbi:MAG: glycoside hydrolase family 38 N-terminal domain-containing protein [Candidatus Thorarchaeota archaeon]|jgi:alpha-mannosidase